MAASTRERTPSLARMRETWTLAVFSEMNSVSPISRLVWPSASSSRTVSSRSVRPEAVDPGIVVGGASVVVASSAQRARAGPGPRPRPPAAARAGLAATSAASRSASVAAARSAPPTISASAFAPAGVAALEGLVQRREALGRRGPRRRGQAALGARELRGARARRTRRARGPARRRASARAPAGRAGSRRSRGRRAAPRRRVCVAERERPLRAIRGGTQGGRVQARREVGVLVLGDEVERAGGEPPGVLGLGRPERGLGPSGGLVADPHRVAACPRAARAPARSAPPRSSSRPRRMARWAALSFRTTAATPLGPSARTRSTMAARLVEAAQARRVASTPRPAGTARTSAHAEAVGVGRALERERRRLLERGPARRGTR